MPDDEILTIEELASFLKLTPQTIYKWAQTGKVPGAKLGKEWRFRRSDINRWLDERLADGPAGRRARASKLEREARSDGARGATASAEPAGSSPTGGGSHGGEARGRESREGGEAARGKRRRKSESSPAPEAGPGKN